jgi:hypothetical protein
MYLGAGVGEGRTEEDLEGAVDLALAAEPEGLGQPLDLPAQPHEGALQQVGEPRHRLRGHLGHVLPGTADPQDAQDVALAPGQLLQLDQPVVRVHPDELVGARDVRVDGLEARVAHESARRRLRALRAAQRRVGRGRGVRAHRQLLDRELDVLEAGARPGHLQLARGAGGAARPRPDLGQGRAVTAPALARPAPAVPLAHRGREPLVLGHAVQGLGTVAPVRPLGRRTPARVAPRVRHARVARRAVLVRGAVARAFRSPLEDDASIVRSRSSSSPSAGGLGSGSGGIGKTVGDIVRGTNYHRQRTRSPMLDERGTNLERS